MPLKVFGFTAKTTVEHLEEHFSKYGKLKQVNISQTTESAHVEFEDPAVAKRVLSSGTMKGAQTVHIINGENVYCRYHTPKPHEENNIPSEVSIIQGSSTNSYAY